MDDLIERLRALSRHEHDDLSIGDEAAGEIERLQSSLARHVDSVCALTAERDALQGWIEEAEKLLEHIVLWPWFVRQAPGTANEIDAFLGTRHDSTL